mgnify:CR=1 FL=1
MDTTWNVISEDCVELRYKEKEEMFIESDYISEITAALTTATARIRLYQMLDWLHPSQVCYCDADSEIYISMMKQTLNTNPRRNTKQQL